MECKEISKMLEEMRRNNQGTAADVPDSLLSLLTVLRSFQCQGFVEVKGERQHLLNACHDEVAKMKSTGFEPHDDILRLIEHFKGV
jgi:hypothetical protein